MACQKLFILPLQFLIIILLVQSKRAYECDELEEFNSRNKEKFGADDISDLLTPEAFIAEGAIGKVFVVPWKDDELKISKVAIKKCRSDMFNDLCQNEVDKLSYFAKKKLRHVLKFFGCFKKDGKIHMVLEHLHDSFAFKRVSQSHNDGIRDSEYEPFSFFMTYHVADGTVKNFLDLPAIERLKVYRQMVFGLHEIHSFGYAHNDIKPDNIMTSDAAFSRIKIVDLGLAAKEDEGLIMGHRKYADEDKIEKFEEAGHNWTPTSSEIIPLKDNWKGDIWALAMVIYELETASLPSEVGDNSDLLNLTVGETIRDKILNKEWMVKKKINLCNKPLLKTPVCFYDILSAMTQLKRKDRTIRALEIMTKLTKIIGDSKAFRAAYSQSSGLMKTLKAGIKSIIDDFKEGHQRYIESDVPIMFI